MRELYAPLIFRWCRRMGLEAEDAADVAQEVFLAAFKALPNFSKQKEGDTFRGWLRTITKRKVYDWCRQQKKQVKSQGGSDAAQMLQQVPDPDAQPEEPGEADDAEDRRDRATLVRKAVEMVLPGFPDWYAEVYRRVILGEEDPEEVGKMLGMRRSAVYNAKSRILMRLKEEFRDLFEV